MSYLREQVSYSLEEIVETIIKLTIVKMAITSPRG